jgi:hypothetical protein
VALLLVLLHPACVPLGVLLLLPLPVLVRLPPWLLLLLLPPSLLLLLPPSLLLPPLRLLLLPPLLLLLLPLRLLPLLRLRLLLVVVVVALLLLHLPVPHRSHQAPGRHRAAAAAAPGLRLQHKPGHAHQKVPWCGESEGCDQQHSPLQVAVAPGASCREYCCQMVVLTMSRMVRNLGLGPPPMGGR